MPVKVYGKPLDFAEIDLDVNNNRIEIWAFNRESEMCLFRIEDYKIPTVLELPILESTKKWTSKNISTVITKLKSNVDDSGKRSNLISGFKKCKDIRAHPFFGYLKGERDYLELRFGSSAKMKLCKRTIANTPVNLFGKDRQLHLWEDDMEAVRKFTIERNLSYADWFSAEATIVPAEGMISRLKPGNEYIASWNTFSPVPAIESKTWFIYPRLFSFDIESYSDNHNIFPSALRPGCPCFMISVNFQLLGKPETRKKYCIVMGDGEIPPDATVFYVRDEEGLLDKFVDLLSELDGDVLIGHNVLGFDYSYLNTRLENLVKKWGISGSRLKDREPVFFDESWQSSNTQKVNVQYVHFPGRITVDTLPVSKAIVKLPNYTLNTVAKKFLPGRSKRDVSHKQLFKGFEDYTTAKELLERCTERIDENGKFIKHSNVERKVYRQLISKYAKSMIEMGKLIDYCNEDSSLALDLFEKLNIWTNLVESSNTIQVRMRHVFTKGQGYKGMSQLYADLKNDGVVFNGSSIEVRKEKYEGALNLGKVYKKVGFFRDAISGDIQSMYPSIMDAHNLCPSTEITAEEAKAYAEGQFNRHKWKDYEGTEKEFEYDVYFVTKEVHIGFIPKLVMKLKGMRLEVKKELKDAAEKSFEYTRLDAKQNAIKIVMNSLYGILGTSKNPRIPAKHIAALVTKIGRETLMKIVKFIEHGGPPEEDPILPRGEIVYGDTDSVQFIIPGMNYDDPKQWIALGQKYIKALCDYIKPLVLVFEKFGDFMFITPKKYIFHARDIEDKLKDGSLNPNFGKYCGFKYTGVDVVKRNQCELTKRLYKELSELIMNEDYKIDMSHEEREAARLQAVVDNVFGTVINTLNRKYPISDFVIHEAYNKESKTSPMGVFASNMAKLGKPIQIGERVGYVIVNYPGEKRDAKKGTKMRLVESIGKNERIDVNYYIDKMITPIDALLRARYKNSKEYSDFIDNNRVLKKFSRILVKRNFLKKSPKDSPEAMFMSLLKAKFAESKNASAIKLPKRYVQLMEFRESEEYKENVEKGVKSSLSRIINKINDTGIPLLMKLPDFINNMVTADNLGVLDKYAKIMCSKKKYRELYDDPNARVGAPAAGNGN